MRRSHGRSNPPAQCVDGSVADAQLVEYPLLNQLLQRVLHQRVVDAEPDGASDLIGGRTAGGLRRDGGCKASRSVRQSCKNVTFGAPIRADGGRRSGTE